MTTFSDVLLMWLIFGGYIVHHGGLRGAWDHLCGRIKTVFEDSLPELVKWVQEKEKK